MSKRLENEERYLAALEAGVERQRRIVDSLRNAGVAERWLPEPQHPEAVWHDHTPAEACWRGCPARR